MNDVEIRSVDFRGLPPPEPLVRSLEASRELPTGVELVILTDRRPAHLLPLLVERGFLVATRQLEDAHETRIRR